MRTAAYWLLRWLLWLPRISRGLAECGDTHVGLVALSAGAALGPIGGLAAANLVQPAMMTWGSWFLLSVIWYFFIGLCTFFVLEPMRNYGAWHERGAW